MQMAHRPVLWVLWSACWQSVQAGLLEQAIDTVHRTIFPDQQTGNPFASLPTFRTSQVSTINSSADDPTSMHFRNQDFSIVLGKDGLKTIDSILDRVFNLTTKLQMQRGKLLDVNNTEGTLFQNFNRTNQQVPTPIEHSKPESDLSLPGVEVLGVTVSQEKQNLFENPGENLSNSESHLHEKDVSSSTENLKSLIRRRPILTDQDAPNYFDPTDGLLKANEALDKITIENAPKAISTSSTESAKYSGFANEQENSVQNIGKQIDQIEQNSSTKNVQSRTTTRTTLLQGNQGNTPQLSDTSQNNVLDDGISDEPPEDDSSRLVALQLPGVGSFVVQKPTEKPKLSVMQKWLLGPLLEPQNTNPFPVSSFLVGTTKAARVSKNSSQTSSFNDFSSGHSSDESGDEFKDPVILSEPAQPVNSTSFLSGAVVTSKHEAEKGFNLSDRPSDRNFDIFNKTDANFAPQEDGELQKDVWGSRFHSLGIQNKEANEFQHNLRLNLPREVLPLALKQQMRAPNTNDDSRSNNSRSRKKGKEIGGTENFSTKNYTTFSINSPNLENIVIYTNNPNIEVDDLSTSASNSNLSGNDDSHNSTGTLTDEHLPLYPPLGNFDVDVKLATSEVDESEIAQSATGSTDVNSTTARASNNNNTSLSDNRTEVTSGSDNNLQGNQSSIPTPGNTTSTFPSNQENNTLQSMNSPGAVFQGSSYQFYSSPGYTDMYGSGTMATRTPNYGNYKTYSSPGGSLSSIQTQVNDFVSGTSSASKPSIVQQHNSPRSPLRTSYGSPANGVSSTLLGSDSLTWPTHKHTSQDLVLQNQFFDPTFEQENLREYLRRIFRLNQLVPIDVNRAIAKLLLDESKSFRQFNERNSFSHLTPSQQAVLYSLTDFSSPTSAQQFSLTQPRLRSAPENQDWLTNSNAEETARSIYEALVSASQQEVKNLPFHRRNSFALSRERFLLPFERRSRSLRKIPSSSFRNIR